MRRRFAGMGLDGVLIPSRRAKTGEKTAAITMTIATAAGRRHNVPNDTTLAEAKPGTDMQSISGAAGPAARFVWAAPLLGPARRAGL